jgi:hypothetical protein
MGFEHYHEPPDELPKQTRTFARMIASLIEKAEAIGWYEQRMAVETNSEARAIMANAQKEVFKHFGMDLEFLDPADRERLRLDAALYLAPERFSGNRGTNHRLYQEKGLEYGTDRSPQAQRQSRRSSC